MQKRPKNISANNYPNATAGTMNLSAVFTRVEVLKTHHHPQSSNFPNTTRCGTASSKIRPNSTVCNKGQVTNYTSVLH
jgi:hypothetical protein